MLPTRDNVRTVCALHQQGDMYRAVVAQIGGSGGMEIKTVDSVRISAGPAAITSIVERVGGVDLVIRVLTGAASIVRTCGLPESTGEAVESDATRADALNLIAESELPGSLPGYRRCAGLVQPGRGPGRKPVGVLVGWPQNSQADLDDTQRPPRMAPEIFVSEPAALAYLAQMVGGVERAWIADRARGAVSIVAVGPEKTLVRVARVPGDDEFADSTAGAIHETSRLAGLKSPVSNGSATLVLEPVPQSVRIGGLARDGTWVEQFGLACAAIAMYADQNPTVNGLANLHEIEPKTKPPMLVRITQWLGQPKRAAAIIAFCVIAVVGVPIGVSYARMRILEKQVGDWQQVFDGNERNDRELTFYRMLAEKRWPMTKLLSDIAGACPVGISLDAVELGVGEQVVIRGVAEDSGKITTFRGNLGNTRIFTDVASPSSSPVAGGGVQFQITAKIPTGAARLDVKPVEDYAAKTLMQRMYGDSARASHSTGSRGDRSSRTDRRSTTSSRDSSSDRSSSSSGSARSTTAAPKEPLVIPPALSDADIATLTKTEDVMAQWGQRRRASTQQGLDETTKRRLTDEAQKLRDRLQQLKAGGGG